MRLAASIKFCEVIGPCVVWDMSNTGAKVAAPQPFLLPPNFTLIFSPTVQRRYEIKWRRERFVGVKFM
jgi:hypothetical protein